MTPTPGPRPADRFRLPAAGSTAAARQIAARIRAEGPISFAAFMETALYDPSVGYYRSGRATVGREGDFLTSPELHPLFGYAVAALAAADWEARDRPERYTLWDVGPGTGALTAAVFAWAIAQRPDFASALHGVLVEPGRIARQRQRERLGEFADRLRWVNDLESAASAEAGAGLETPRHGMVVANEVLDAQPVHRLRWHDDRWQELRVGLASDGLASDGLAQAGGEERFVDVPAAPDPPSLIEPLRDTAPSDGQIVEVCPGIAALIAALGAPLDDGLLLVFDYGHRHERLYAPWRKQGTLMSFYRHIPGDDPYQRVGEQDLTCHVDIDAVADAAAIAGLRAYPVRSQAEWLAAMGATALAPIAEAGSGAEMDAHLDRRRAVQLLSDPAGLGRIQVMAFAKGTAHDLLGLDEPGAPETTT